MALRVIAGELKGRKLRTARGAKTRPTANRTREAIFNIIAPLIAGARVLDLFAGSGAFGIEALSRGADTAVFVDIDVDSISVLQANIKTLSLESKTKIIRWDLIKNLNCLQTLQKTFNLVFMDPPYHKNMIEPTLLNLYSSQSMATSARIIVEHSRREPVVADHLPFEYSDRRKYGKTLVTILEFVL